MSNPILRAVLMAGLALPAIAAAQQPLDLAALHRTWRASTVIDV